MKRTAFVLIFVFCALINSPAQAQADDKGMARFNMMRKHEKMWHKMGFEDMLFMKARFIMANADEIGLSDEQIEKIKTLKMSAKKNLIKKDADIKILALDIKAELSKEEINLSTVNGLIDKKYAAKTQKAKDLAASYVSLKKVLSKEQCTKLKELWECSMSGTVKCVIMPEESAGMMPPEQEMERESE